MTKRATLKSTNDRIDRTREVLSKRVEFLESELNRLRASVTVLAAKLNSHLEPDKPTKLVEKQEVYVAEGPPERSFWETFSW